MAVEIYVKSVDLGVEGKRFDFYGKNLPNNLLGLAGDLQFKGDLSNYTYQKIEAGDGFKIGSATAKMPILMASQDWGNGKLIVGLTQRADQLVKVSDGKIFSVYFAGKGKLQFSSFDKQILSVYDGKRVDLKMVNWIDQEQGLIPFVKAKAVSVERSEQQTVNEQLQTSVVQPMDEQVLPVTAEYSMDGIFAYWWLIAGVLLVVILVVVLIWLRRSGKSKFA